ncbi:MAG: cysteine--tRNA ligase [Gammaproteobacteria bacterium]|nr:cysteine--tRNA ligase [Gammaproteobacteria bacterium]
MLHIYNTLTKQKEVFTPIDPQNVRMYVCGMTVYDFCHIGHSRVLMVFDVVNRYLRKIYGDEHVTYVRNITDIDDNIIKRANQNGEVFTALTARFIDEMNTDAQALNVKQPDVEPLATEHMDEIIAMIKSLIENGYAYQADSQSENNDVFYDIDKFEHYGALSGKHLDDLRAGERVEVDKAKRNPMDFALWKSAKPDEPSWDSPWGKGRPGWHIECSAMSTHCLGNHFDIHGGGMDLQFPHHENEIAQSEAATGEKFVNVWMHNGFVRVDDEKMSKSLGNFFTIRDVLKEYDPEVIRYFILSSHYRSPLNYSDKHLDNAKASLTTLYNALRGVEIDLNASDQAAGIQAGVQARESIDEVRESIIDEVRESIIDEVRKGIDRFEQAMDDDFNTPLAISELFNLSTAINNAKKDNDFAKASQLALQIKKLGGVLGLLERDPEAFLKGSRAADDLSHEAIEQLIMQRGDAKKNKQWADADRIRDELSEKGVILEDSVTGTKWRRE